MTYDSQALLTLFGRLFQQRAFVSAAVRSTRMNECDPQRNSNQLRLLHLLTEHDHLTNSDIVEDLDIRPSSVSALVAKLEDAGLIERQASPDDKRVALISLTTAGHKFLETAHKAKDDFSEALFTTLSEAEQAQLRDILQKLLKDLEAKQPSDWAKSADFRAFMEQAQVLHRGHGMHRHEGGMGMRGGIGPNMRDMFGDGPRRPHDNY
ncbi:transcriptional regulator [Levilactobacillus zymae]|uniref:Transcriptional regulator n=1 Tax=Levilactobacillus zymae TaxID=267363 RepID=A0ABQ0WZM0_9LACO|nr:MarR family transcriptional regulator [Levilactobacillus zymae]KRL16421.1 transcriptional regulator [Levilactobacillus zymae DSM 19395]QFR61805.1 MarR family transcriptional regulator [Levilactobacillus zymae]GEO72872.1 transcriptional regulator [Levilactobacillus zymae]